MKAIMRTVVGKAIFHTPDYLGEKVAQLPPSVFVEYDMSQDQGGYRYIRSRLGDGWVFQSQDAHKPLFTSYEPLDWADGFDAPVGTLNERLEGKVWPGEWYDASPFPNRYLVGTKREAFHTGADLNLPHNADAAMPVHAVASGLVVFAGSIDVWGNVVVIQHDPLERTGQVVFSRYAHMNEIYVKRGHRVSRGWNIAKIGNANGTLSEHLHFDISPTFVLQDKPGHWPGLRMSEMCHYVDPKEFILANRPPVRAGYDNDGQLAEYNVYLQDMLRRKKSPLVS